MPIVARIKRALNAFASQDTPIPDYSYSVGMSTSEPPIRTKLRFSNERSIISSIYTRIAIDVAAIAIRHVKVDDQERYVDDVDSALNRCLLFEPNIDQGPRDFTQDIVLTLFDKGVSAVVAIDIEEDPEDEDQFDVASMRVGDIIQWYPRHVRVSVYNDNEKSGKREEIRLKKRNVAIIYNPLYAVMNEPNSTLQRLTRKLHLLDQVDEVSSSGKLDLIIQLPYVIKSEARREQAEKRRQDIEFQLKGSQYGIAYTDGTEKITQLNRPAENNLLKQVEYLQDMLYGQLGLTPEVMNGTADEATMINYYNRTVEPILESIVQAEQRAFLGRKGWEDGERIAYFRNPFKLVPVAQLAEIADKFTRNEIYTSNEFRGFMGSKPSTDPKADELRNSNMPQPELPAAPETPAIPPGPTVEELDGVMNKVLGDLSASLDKIGKPPAGVAALNGSKVGSSNGRG